MVMLEAACVYGDDESRGDITQQMQALASEVNEEAVMKMAEASSSGHEPQNVEECEVPSPIHAVVPKWYASRAITARTPLGLEPIRCAVENLTIHTYIHTYIHTHMAQATSGPSRSNSKPDTGRQAMNTLDILFGAGLLCS